MKTIPTPKGNIHLAPIDRELFQQIRELMPYGIVGLKSADKPLEYGLVMQCDDTEVMGIKLQPPDCSREQVNAAMETNIILSCIAILYYLQNSYEGLLIPFPYLRDKGNHFEAGISVFVFPKPGGKETLEDIEHAGAYDNQFGQGATAMLVAFVRALQKASKESNIPLYPVIGMEPRFRMQLGSLSFGYMVMGAKVIAIKTTITEKDFTWTILRDAGISDIAHMPSQPATISKDDLSISKPLYTS
ncbi:MAG: hypothetical protein OEL57_16255 [Trichlorobacter sp.]|uniref:hypothetical protein n=1 Tax=Trichlorobacter sp. TaxID=2911007 RepID=UPI00256C1939|nr:hypothetical protein [Trichlorobacter sp.]MDK9719435.1 hypothetical protein [Trichlorobacter sp.]